MGTFHSGTSAGFQCTRLSCVVANVVVVNSFCHTLDKEIVPSRQRPFSRRFPARMLDSLLQIARVFVIGLVHDMI